jgi:pimeloyl-ACP methyl ester carboxylesterase
MLRSRYGCWITLVLLCLPGCYSVDSSSLPNPPLSQDKGMVILFAGWTPPGTSVVGTGMYDITQQLRAIGIRAEIYAPDQWENAATDTASLPQAPIAPIAIVGYSLGAAAATRLASALADKGIPVETLVVIEAWAPVPIACNVRKAVDIFSSDSFLSLSSRLDPGSGFSGSLEQVNYSELTGGRYSLDHWTISKFDNVHGIVRQEILEDGRVRRRPAPAGQGVCTSPPRAAASP